MSARVCPIAVVAIGCLAASLAAAAPDPLFSGGELTRSISATGQFTAYSENPLLAPQLCAVAERLKRQWQQTLRLPDGWRDPIVFVARARGDATNAPALHLQAFRTPLHLKYQIDCRTPPPIDPTDFRAMLVESLCAEFANRREVLPRGAALAPAAIPPWLTYGLAQSLDERADSLLAVARRSVVGGHPTEAAALLDAAAVPELAIERELFVANAWLFVEGLLALPRGAEKVQDYLAALGQHEPARPAFTAAFQKDFTDDVALEKWWCLMLAQRTAATVAENLSAEETMRRLDATLHVQLDRPVAGYAMGTEVALAQLWLQSDQTWFHELLETKLNQLQALRSLANPRYVALIDQYTAAWRDLHEKRVRAFRRDNAAANQWRERIDRKTDEIAVYLDRAEHRFTPAGTHTFDGDFRILEQTEPLGAGDAIGDYLDRFEK